MTPDSDIYESSYEVDVVESISGQLTHLRTPEQFAKEIIQNADDAEATSLTFDFSPDRLLIHNNESLSQCDGQKIKSDSKNCEYLSKSDGNLYCDVHAIRRFSSANKKKNSEATGKFGVGLVSAFLYTDDLKFRSQGISLWFDTEIQKWKLDDSSEVVNGTELHLPWATNSKSTWRTAMDKDAVKITDIRNIADDIIDSCKESILFARNLTEITVLFNEKIEFHIKKVPSQGNRMAILDLISGKKTIWMRIKSNAQIEEKLANYKKTLSVYDSCKVEIEILVPENAKSDFNGLLFATLPTDLHSGMPLHINADFFPDTSRSQLIFNDGIGEPKSRWNDYLIDGAARLLAESIPEISQSFGNITVWKIIEGALKMDRRTGDSVPSKSFLQFWTQIKAKSATYQIVECQKGELHFARDILIFKRNVGDGAFSLADSLGIHYSKNREGQRVSILAEFGAPWLTQELLGNYLEKTEIAQKYPILDDDSWESFWTDLYSTINELSSIEGDLDLLLQEMEIWASETRTLVSLKKLRNIDVHPRGRDLARLFPSLVPANKVFSTLNNIDVLVKTPDSYDLCELLNNNGIEAFKSKMSTDAAKMDISNILVELLRPSVQDTNHLKVWRNFPIWPQSSSEFTSLDGALLPGNFNDPLGIGRILASEQFNKSSSDFLIAHLGVKVLTLDSYLDEVLPNYLRTHKLHASHCLLLLKEVNSQVQTITNEQWQVLSRLEIIPIEESGVGVPGECLKPSKLMKQLFTESARPFVDLDALGSVSESESELDALLTRIGVATSPTIELIVEAWLFNQRSKKTLKAIKEAISLLAIELVSILSKIDKEKNAEFEISRTHFSELLFPCKLSCNSLHKNEKLIQPRWAKAICDQEGLHEVYIDFPKQSTNLVQKYLGIEEKVEISLVVAHLLHCVEDLKKPNDQTYQLLNQYAKGNEYERREILNLKGKAVIYTSDSGGRFIPPNRIFGALPRHLNFLKSYSVVTPSAPEGLEDLWALLDIPRTALDADVVNFLPQIKEDFNTSKSSADSEAIENDYQLALSIIGNGFTRGELWATEYASIFSANNFALTLGNQWKAPCETLIADTSSWAARLELFSESLIKIDPIAYLFLSESGSRLLSKSIRLHDASLVIKGDSDLQVTERLQKHSSNIIGFLLKEIEEDSMQGGRIQAQEKFHELNKLSAIKAIPVNSLEIEVSVLLGTRERQFTVKELSELYVKDQVAVAYLRGVRDPYKSVLKALLMTYLPGLTDDLANQKSLSIAHFIGGCSPEEANRILKEEGMITQNLDSYLSATDEVVSIPFDGVNKEATQAEDPIGTSGDEDTDSTGDEEFGSKDSPSTKPNADTSSPPTPSALGTSHPKPPLHNGNSEQPTRKDSDNREPTDRPPTQPKTPPSSDGEQSQSFDEKKSSRNRPASGNHGKARSGYVYPEPSNPDKESYVENTEVEKSAIHWIRKREWEIFRDVEDANELYGKNNPGFDLISRSPTNPKDVRYIEVKSLRGEWDSLGVYMSRTQLEFAIDYGAQVWLYVVEYALNPERTRLHRIKDPWSNMGRFYFDDGWRVIAEVEPSQNPPALLPGMRIKHCELGAATITGNISRQGQEVFFRVTLDSNGNSQLLQWDQEVIELDAPGDDDAWES